MSVLVNIRDSLKNFVANLNTERDKQSSSFYATPHFSYEQLTNAYRGSWIARKIVTIPAKDAVRKWREWQADETQIEMLENEEKRLGLQGKTRHVMESARLYGGAGIYIGVDGQDPYLPLDPKTIGKGGLKYLTVLPKRVLNCGELETDPLSQNYGKPKYYDVTGSELTQRIHPSRVVRFIGAEFPDPEIIDANLNGWGDSALTAPYDAIRNADSIAANIASLVFEAKVDILKIPGLGDIMADPKTRGLLQERVALAAQLKGNNGMLIIDGEEEHDSKSFTFAGLTDIDQQALQAVSGAADIPVTRFLGQTPSGLSSTGESDLRNYYDSVASIQTLDIDPAFSILNEVLIRSALGDRPKDVSYQWSSLWQMDDNQKSEISKRVAETIKTLAETRLFPDDDLSEAAVNMLIEHSVMPSLEITGEVDPEDDDEGALQTGDASTPKPLYVHRKVLNASDIVKWAKAQGFKQTISPSDMHVTVAFSRAPVDWTEIGQDWSGDQQGRIRIKPGGPRLVEVLGEDAKVLKFSSEELEWRHKRMLDAGASWDWNEYQPHITITYGDMPENVEPYTGPIVLGPEIFEELDLSWKEKIEETNT